MSNMHCFFVICTSISIQFNVIHKFIDGKDTTIFQYYQTDNNLFQATKSSFLCEKIIFDKKFSCLRSFHSV